MIDHYKYNSVKIKAIYFLIANMKDQYNIDSTSMSFISKLVFEYDSLVTNRIFVNKINKNYPLIDSSWNRIVRRDNERDLISRI